MISAVVLTKNEEKNLKACLNSLNWCDEIIVIDDYSQDKTAKIAQKIGAKVFLHSLNHNYAQQRNFGLKKAKGDWVLFVDGDERISSALAEEIQTQNSKLKTQNDSVKLKANQPVAFYLKRKDFLFGKWLKYGETGKIRLLRLGRKNAGRWQGKVHEVWQVKGKTSQLKNPLLHYPHPTIKEFLEKIDYYSEIRVEELFQKGVRTNFFEVFAYPLAKFVNNYFCQFGFLGGLAGFLQAMMMSFYSFLVRSKLWLKY